MSVHRGSVRGSVRLYSVQGGTAARFSVSGNLNKPGRPPCLTISICLIKVSVVDVNLRK